MLGCGDQKVMIGAPTTCGEKDRVGSNRLLLFFAGRWSAHQSIRTLIVQTWCTQGSSFGHKTAEVAVVAQSFCKKVRWASCIVYFALYAPLSSLEIHAITGHFALCRSIGEIVYVSVFPNGKTYF